MTAFRRDVLAGRLTPVALAQVSAALHEKRQRLDTERKYMARTAGERHPAVGALSDDLRAVVAAIAEVDDFGKKAAA